MPRFTTDNGREFAIHYTLPAAREIRKECGVNLLDAADVQRVCADFLDFVELLWHSVRKQAEREGVSEEEFVLSLERSGQAAVDAWLAAFSDFSERIGRSALARLAESAIENEKHSQKTANELVSREVAKRLTQRQNELDTKSRRKALAELLGESVADESNPPTPGA